MKDQELNVYEIPIEGLPEGWEVNTIEIDAKQFPGPPFNTVSATVHLRKTKPRRIVQIDDYDPSSPNGFD